MADRGVLNGEGRSPAPVANRPDAPPTIAGRGLLVVLPLSTGAAVLVYLVTDVSLPLTALLLAVVGAGALAFVHRRLSPAGRRYVAGRTRVGLFAGVVATAVYDLSRYVLVAAASMSLKPFKAFALFGQTFVGADASSGLQYAVGTVYHVLNGLGFAVAYAIFFPRPQLRTAVLWAGVLELATILLYPSWLRLNALGELATVSVLGHVAYGLGLGLACRGLLDRARVPA